MTYYNENDPKAAAWLRELISRGLIAPGIVDERSILDVRSTDLSGYAQCHFFAGIGGWSYALRLAGWPDDRPVWTGTSSGPVPDDVSNSRGRSSTTHGNWAVPACEVTFIPDGPRQLLVLNAIARLCAQGR